MKTFNIIPVLLLGLLTACDNMLEDVSFTVTPASTNVYKVGEPIVFDFTGNPDYITFFSGEEGSNYKNRFRTEIAMEDIESAEFSFAAKRQYGTQTNTLEFYVSDSFEGLAKKDAQQDLDAIQKHSWTKPEDVNTALEKASASAFTPMGPIDISSYLNNFVVAFKFTGTTGATQRTWTLNGFKIRCTLKSGTVIESGSASSLNFTALDVLAIGTDKDPYAFTRTGSVVKGTWSGLNVASNQIQMQGGDAKVASNEDWLVSAPLKLNSCTPDKGTALKDMTSRLNQYSYTFEKPGTYDVVFVAGNSNYKGESEVVRTVTVTVE